MNATDYQRLAMRTAPDIPATDMLINAALGLAGEAGEVAEIVKKAMYHGRWLGVDHLRRELGDVLWYVALACTACSFDMGDVMQANIDKLRERWPDGFKPGTKEAGGDSAINGIRYGSDENE